MKVTTNALQVMGGSGYMKEYPLEKMMRDAKILQIYEGTNQIQRNVIGQAIIKEAAKTRTSFFIFITKGWNGRNHSTPFVMFMAPHLRNRTSSLPYPSYVSNHLSFLHFFYTNLPLFYILFYVIC